jgi:hypothetical protein
MLDGSPGDLCDGTHIRRTRKVAVGWTCKVIAPRLCPFGPPLSSSTRTAVISAGTIYSCTTSHGTAVIPPSFIIHYLGCQSNAWQVLPIVHPRTPPSALGNRGSLGLSLKEAFQIWRAVNHVAHVTDRLVDKSPDFIVRDAKPAFTKRIVL